MAVTAVVVERGTKQLRGIFNEMFVVTGTLDASNLADAAGETQTCAVPGVVLGDVVMCFSFGVDLAGVTITAYVSAADVVSLRIQNESAGAVNLASTTVKLVIVRSAF